MERMERVFSYLRESVRKNIVKVISLEICVPSFPFLELDKNEKHKKIYLSEERR